MTQTALMQATVLMNNLLQNICFCSNDVKNVFISLRFLMLDHSGMVWATDDGC